MRLNGLPTQNALSLLKGTNASTPSSFAKSTKAALGPVIAALEKSDPAKAQALKEQQEKSNQLVDQLEASRVDLKEQRKELARQKVERLKAQIQALQLAGGDPKSVARQAARLARELASAAKDYANAGGGAAVPAGAEPAASATPKAADAATKTQAGAAVPGQDAAAAKPSEASPEKAASEAEAATETEEKQAQEPSAAEAQATPNAAELEAEAPRETIAAQSATASGPPVLNQADAKFVKDVRRLMDELKKIVQAAKHKMQAQGANDQDIKTAEKALADTKKALDEITKGTFPVGTSLNILV